MRIVAVILLLCAFPVPALAGGPDFTGTWTIDFRTKAERKKNVECGNASFILVQNGTLIVGDHNFATKGCGRINEGGPNTVKGVVVGNTAVLVVTSGRNGAIVMGKAILAGNALDWETVEEIKGGDPEGDAPLILQKGSLVRQDK